MITPEFGTSVRFSIRRALAMVVVLAALATACNKDSNDITGTTTSGSTVNVAGSWVGTFTPVEPAFYAEPVAAQASLQQTGADVDGTITIAGYAPITIHATVTGFHVSGTIADPSGPGTALGGLVSAKLSLVLHPHRASGDGQLVLHR
jgi:hypothetical protein